MKLFFLSVITAANLCLSSLPAAEPAMSGAELADRMNVSSQGNASIRARLEIRSGGGAHSFQLQIKQRRTKTATDILYEVLWPNERRGETVVLHQAQNASKGWTAVPQQPVREITASQMSEGLFDSDLSYQDAVENFFAWKKQAIVGAEPVNGINCQILESTSDTPSTSVYAKVRSWVDTHRFVPLRVEKYSASGDVVRRIDITRVAFDEKHKPIPANFTVHGPRKDSVTELNGARIDQDVQFTDADFAPPDNSR